MSWPPGTLAIAAMVLLGPGASGPSREVDNVAAFARLYGVLRFFYPSDAAAELDWNRFAVHGVAQVRGAGDGADLERRLRALVAPLGPGIEIAARLSPPGPLTAAYEPQVAWRYLGPGGMGGGGAYKAKRTHRSAAVASGAAEAELLPEWPPTPGAYTVLDLGSGLRARVALTLGDTEARGDPRRKGDRDALRTAQAAVEGPSETPGIDQRLADVVVAWSVFRHFYPYWTEAGVDWDGRLAPRLLDAAAAANRAAQHDALRGLVSDARDGHGRVADTFDKSERGELPVRLDLVEDRLVVIVSGVPSELPVGALLTTIDAQPAAEWLARATSLASGTAQWRRAAAIRRIVFGAKGSALTLGFDDGRRRGEATLRYGEPQALPWRREAVTEVATGIWYVDLTRATMALVQPKLAILASARGVVFDVRGYPTDAGFGILPHLIAAAESDRWMHVAKIVGPSFKTAGWLDIGWNLAPASPRILGKVVFLTDGGAISYAESVMGYVGDRKLATIVGSTTAGTNGNVATFPTPGGFSVNFTGMRVTRHDGQPFHLVGVVPDVAATPTLAGVRAGRDEVLERALQLVP